MKKYNKEWDSYYDDKKDIWLESPCQYEDCEFCSNRPTKPSACSKPIKEEDITCDCHMMIGGSGEPCPDCKLNGCAYCKPKTNRKVFKSQDIKKEVENGKH